LPSSDDFGWAQVGPGNIARRFAGALRGSEGARLAAVVGRDAGRAAAFAAEWAPGASSGSDLAAALARPGKPVLCEKPLTPSAATTRPLVDLAQAWRLFLMEAVWTPFLQICATARQWIAEGRIGAVRAMQSSFLLQRAPKPGDRRHTAAQGGGTLLDIGVYCITVSRIALPGVPVRSFEVQALENDEGVDVQLAHRESAAAGRRIICGGGTDGRDARTHRRALPLRERRRTIDGPPYTPWAPLAGPDRRHLHARRRRLQQRPRRVRAGPSLGFVMGGATAIVLPAFALAKRRRISLLGTPLQLPASSAIDRRLDLGSMASLAGMQALELLERRAKRSSS
jgi:hypothetical protein